jgi:hypothetical protein
MFTSWLVITLYNTGKSFKNYLSPFTNNALCYCLLCLPYIKYILFMNKQKIRENN